MPISTHNALTHFKESDPKMALLLEKALTAPNPVELPKRKPESAWFGSIVKSITSQQISTKAAASIHGRILSELGTVTPESVLQTKRSKLRACGLSDRKVEYVYYNAQMWPTLPTKQFKKMDDEAIITEMTKLYGIGRWTVEMFLMFSLARPNVFSYGDLGLMQGLVENYEFRPHWKRKITSTVDAWTPHKTLASLTLWYWKDGGPLIL